MKGEVEYRAIIAVTVDLRSNEVESVNLRAATAADHGVDLSVTLDSEEDEVDEVYDRAQQIVDAGGPFEVSGWWAPAPDQRWAPVVENECERSEEVEDVPVRLQRPPAKETGQPPPYAFAYRNELLESYREALRQAAIVYLDACYDALREIGPGESFADSAIGWYLPRRYEHYYDGRFARDWIAAVTVVGWKLGQPGEIALSCVAEELALWALIKQAEVQLEIAGEDSDPGAWSDFRDCAFEDEDFLWLYSPEFDGIEESEWGREHRRREPEVQRMVQAVRCPGRGSTTPAQPRLTSDSSLALVGSRPIRPMRQRQIPVCREILRSNPYRQRSALRGRGHSASRLPANARACQNVYPSRTRGFLGTPKRAT